MKNKSFIVYLLLAVNLGLSFIVRPMSGVWGWAMIASSALLAGVVIAILKGKDDERNRKA